MPPPSSGPLEFLISYVDASPPVISFSDHDYHATFTFDSLHINSSIILYIVNNTMIYLVAPINICSIALLMAIKCPLSNITYLVPNSFSYIILPITVGPHTMILSFTVAFSIKGRDILLGIPWIFTAQSIPSMNHLCFKFIHNKQFVTIKGGLPCRPFPKPSIDNILPPAIASWPPRPLKYKAHSTPSSFIVHDPLHDLFILINPLVHLVSLSPLLK